MKGIIQESWEYYSEIIAHSKLLLLIKKLSTPSSYKDVSKTLFQANARKTH